MSTQEQRERFEAWFRQQHGWWETPLSLDTGEWEAWQAAESAAIERCAKTARGYSLQAEACILALLPKEES